MAEAVTERKLAAILHADVVGYSRLMGEDETATYNLVAECLDVFAAAISKHQGRVVNYAGDAVLADFTTVTAALTCAVAVQREFQTRNENVPDSRKIQFRIGINLGDVIVDHDDIFGDGVNVAARLEGLAKPGGICISESVRDAIGAKLPYDYEFMGKQQVKNIARPVRAYQVILDPEAATKTTQPGKFKSWLIRLYLLGLFVLAIGVIIWLQPWRTADPPDESVPAAKPGIAVLPFANMSADPEQDYFTDGITEDLISDLSKISGLLVIARNSMFTYKGQAVKVTEVANELGVRYVLEGSVRKAGDQLRISTQLIDAFQGGHLWTERYDRKLENIFALQDEITDKIVQALKLKLTPSERELLAHRYTNNVEAFDYFLRGQALVRTSDYESARQMYRQAIALDPTFARAYGALAMSYLITVNFGGSSDSDLDVEQALRLAQRAIALDDSLPPAYFALSFAHLYDRQVEQALGAIQQALALDPNYADGYILYGWIHTLRGEIEETIRLVDMALRLNPSAHATALQTKAMAYYEMGRFAEALVILEKSRERNPEHISVRADLAAVYAALGRQDDAEWEAEEIMSLVPDFTLQRWARGHPFVDPMRLERRLEHLRQAGLE